MRIAVRPFILLVVWGISSAAAVAQTVEVRSGAHAGYSRLVVEFQDAPDWRLVRISGGFLLRTNATVERFETGSVFLRIPGTRIGGLDHQAGTGNLSLSLVCQCQATAFELARGAVVIDVFDPKLRQKSETESVLETAAVRPRPRPATASGIDGLFDGPVQLLRGTNQPDLSAATPDPEQARTSRRSDSTPPAVPLLDTAPDLSPATELLTRSLAREIARAATQGLVETRRTGTPNPAEAAEPAPDPPNIRIETAHDRIFGPPRDRDAQSVTTDACRSAHDFNVAAWGDDRRPGTQIAEQRLRLVGEFDAFDPDAAIALARLYIHLSFGLEAERILTEIGQDAPNTAFLLELAQLMERDLPPNNTLSQQISCGGAAALWAALALPDLPANLVIDQDAILLAFSALPAHLRRHLGPRLAARFARANNVAAVEMVSNAVGRVAPAADPSLALTKGQAAITGSGEATGVEAVLEDLAAGRHPDAPDALLLIIASYAERGAVVPRNIIDTSDIMAFELAGTELGGALRAATIRARLTRRDFREAFAGLVTALGDDAIAPDTVEALKEEALTALVRTGSDPDFLKRVLDPAGMNFALEADRQLRFELATRLLDLGFPIRANRLATPDTDATRPDELDYAARLSLALGSPARAVEFARRSSTPMSGEIEASSLARAGRYASAAELLQRMGQPSDSLQMSWRARDWDRVAETGEGPAQAAALAFLGADVPEPFPNPPSLSAAEDRLSASAALRQTLDTVLTAYPGPEP
ncbi:MAG: hypothetical protein AAGK37_06570 [Pseudomonadota bacterium]